MKWLILAVFWSSGAVTAWCGWYAGRRMPDGADVLVFMGADFAAVVMFFEGVILFLGLGRKPPCATSSAASATTPPARRRTWRFWRRSSDRTAGRSGG